jgi:hypothetical protein
MERFGKYEARETLFQCSSFDFVQASELAADGSRQEVGLTILTNSHLADNIELVQQLNAFQDFVDPGFGRVLEVSIVAEPRRVVVASEWLPGISLRRLIASDPGIFNTSNMDFALYVLKSLGSALSRLHHWRLLDDRTCVHGYLSPDFVWMDRAAQFRIHAPFLGWVAERENPGRLMEQEDVKALGRMLLSLLGCSGLAGLHRRSGLPADAVRIAAAADFLRSIRDFMHFVDSVTKQGPYAPTAEMAQGIIAKVEGLLEPAAPPEPAFPVAAPVRVPELPAPEPALLKDRATSADVSARPQPLAHPVAVAEPPTSEPAVEEDLEIAELEAPELEAEPQLFASEPPPAPTPVSPETEPFAVKEAEDPKPQEPERPGEETRGKGVEPGQQPTPVAANPFGTRLHSERSRDRLQRGDNPLYTLERQANARLLADAENDLIHGELKECLQKAQSVLATEAGNPGALGLRQRVHQRLDEQCQKGAELLRSAKDGRNDEVRREDAQKSKQMYESVLRVDPNHEAASSGLRDVQGFLDALPKRKAPLTPPSKALGIPRILKYAAGLALLAGIGVGAWFGVKYLQPPAKGKLQLQTEDGIEVVLQGKSLGTAPFKAMDLAPNKYQLVYKFENQEIGSETVDVLSGKTVENKTRALLSRVQFQLDPPDAEVLVNGVLRPSSAPMAVRPGHYAFLFRKNGYQPYAVEKQTTAGQTESISVKLTQAAVAPQAYGTLSVVSRYGLPVEIFEGGVSLGWTPTQLSLPAGTHRLEYRCQGLSQTIVHDIRPGAGVPYPVVFNVKVDINSVPWSEVYLLRSGAADQHLGQTPMQGATVPVGGTIVFLFQNPPTRKTYTVNAVQKTISMRR